MHASTPHVNTARCTQRQFATDRIDARKACVLLLYSPRLCHHECRIPCRQPVIRADGEYQTGWSAPVVWLGIRYDRIRILEVVRTRYIRPAVVNDGHETPQPHHLALSLSPSAAIQSATQQRTADGKTERIACVGICMCVPHRAAAVPTQARPVSHALCAAASVRETARRSGEMPAASRRVPCLSAPAATLSRVLRQSAASA